MIILRRLFVGVLALAVPVAAAGCSARSILPLPTPSPPAVTASLSPTPTPSVSDDPTTPADVEQGLRNWIAAANQAFATGDTKALRALTATLCPCSQIAKTVDGWWASGGVRGLKWTLHSTHIIDVRFQLADVEYQYDEPTFWVVDHGHQSPAHYADRVFILAEFELNDGVWQMRRYRREKAERL